MSRTLYAAKNMLWGNVSAVVTIALQFLTRTVFIYSIGTTFLGINGLFTGILGVLSLAEMGIGAAINFSLYKPVAQRDINRIKTLMRFYKIAYRYIAAVVTIVGLALVPLLPHIIRNSTIDSLYIYYLLYLLNTATSYLVTYKYTLLYAEQKSYIISNLNLLCHIVITITQMAILVIYKSFMMYLVVQILLQITQKLIISCYINRKYPYLLDKDITPMDHEERTQIVTNVKALVVHKLGDISVNQTDNIIISAFVNLVSVGLVSNYRLIYSGVSIFLSSIFSSMTAGLGNVIATESKQRQKELFDVYQFFGFWIFGYVAVCMFTLIQPFMELWLGAERKIDNLSLSFIIIDQYMVGQRITVTNFKTAAGVFRQDQVVPFVQAIINLGVSIGMAMWIGLPGIFAGTVCQSIVASVWRPIIVYRALYDQSAGGYFRNYVKYIVTVGAGVGVMLLLSHVIMPTVTLWRFITMVALCALVPNVLFYALYRKSPEFQYLKGKANALCTIMFKK